MTDAKVIGDDEILIEKDGDSVLLSYDELKNIANYARTQIVFRPVIVRHFQTDEDLVSGYDCGAILDNPELVDEITDSYERIVNETDVSMPDYSLEQCFGAAFKENRDGIGMYRKVTAREEQERD